MRSQRINIRNRIITSLFFIIMGGMIFNSTFFLHSHRTACGKIIVHAHPYNKAAEKGSPFAKHEHNKIELTIFSLINYYTFSENTINLDLYANFEFDLFSKPCLNVDSNIYFFHANRGPPVTIS